MSKTISFGIMHVSVAFLVVWMMTGDILIGGAVALVEPMVNTIAYHFHEKLWARRSAANSDSSMLAA
ncbi:MAG: DUF2061 domain-containing protein [Alcanivoracaceae bacterium]|jgi:uncharacterized membrane protein|nr:DUF2061 domain-containing protein [Alcanivoracaceae bacterium]